MAVVSNHSEQLLFLSGSGLPTWVWDDVRHRIPERIQSTVGPRPPSPATLSAYATVAVANVPSGPFTIVAHSVGAVVGLAVAELVPDRVRGFLAISGVVPAGGASFVSSMPFPRSVLLQIAIRLFGTRPPDKAIARSMGRNVPTEVASRLIQDFDPDSSSLFLERLDYQTVSHQRGYITTATDAEIAPRLQERFATTLRPGWTAEIDSGHLPMIEKPEELAAAIIEFIEQCPRGRRGTIEREST